MAMKELLTQLSGYNQWANKLMIDKMLTLAEGVVDRPMGSSFPTLRATTHHVWSAEDIWLQRLMQTENPVWAEGIFKGSFADACYNWGLASEGLTHFVQHQDETTLTADVTYADLKGNQFATPVNQVLLHVFNHSTYHRGQLISLLRQAGETMVPRTDFIIYARTVLAQ